MRIAALILHTMDILITVSAGGLIAEGNPISAALWGWLGLWSVAAVKGMSVHLLKWVYDRYDGIPYERLFKTMLLTGYFGAQGMIVILNIITIFGGWK